MRSIWAVALASMLALAACGGDGKPAGLTSPSSLASPSVQSTRPASTAKLSIVEPRFGATVEGPTVTVRLKLEGARLLEEASRTITPDTGHVHVALDGRTLTLLAGLTYRLQGVPPGEHLIRAEFAAADHGSFNPPVLAIVRITVT